MPDRFIPGGFPEVRLRLVTEPPRRRTVVLQRSAARDRPGESPRTLLFPWVTLAWGEACFPDGREWLPMSSLRCWGSLSEPTGLDDPVLASPVLPSVRDGLVCLSIAGSRDPVSLFWNSSFQQGAYHKLDDDETTVALQHGPDFLLEDGRVVYRGVSPRRVLAGILGGSEQRLVTHVLRCRAHAAGQPDWGIQLYSAWDMSDATIRLRNAPALWTEDDWRG